MQRRPIFHKIRYIYRSLRKRNDNAPFVTATNQYVRIFPTFHNRDDVISKCLIQYYPCLLEMCMIIYIKFIGRSFTFCILSSYNLFVLQLLKIIFVITEIRNF